MLLLNPLYFSQSEVVVSEVPDHLSLAISISGCPLACRGCHSSQTWNPSYGELLTLETLSSLITVNRHISCVLIYDGHHDVDSLISYFSYIRSRGLATALYTGLDTVSPELASLVDYLKVGPYIESLGGLASPTTNQRIYHHGIDITHIFNRRDL